MSVYSMKQAGIKMELLDPKLFIGVVSEVSLGNAKVNLARTGLPSGTHYYGDRYGRGEVGELVLIESEGQLLLGRITEVKLPEAERRSLWDVSRVSYDLEAVGRVGLLGTVDLKGQEKARLKVKAGIKRYPRLGDRVYSAPVKFISQLPALMEDTKGKEDEDELTLDLGYISGAQHFMTALRIERIFGRHCAIIGTTGGGKSWTMAKLIEECMKYNAKIILFDPTGEYSAFSDDESPYRNDAVVCRLDVENAGSRKEEADCMYALPPEAFTESDFYALFTPSRQTQAPVLRRAIRSLRLVKCLEDNGRLNDELNDELNGYLEDYNGGKCLKKEGKDKEPVLKLERKFSGKLEDPNQGFNPLMLPKQIVNECVKSTPGNNRKSQKSQESNSNSWGGIDNNLLEYCNPLITRIEAVINSSAFYCVFKSQKQSIEVAINNFIGESRKKLLRICFDEIPYEFNAREILANTIGRMLLKKARKGELKNNPTIVFLDEAHSFLGRQLEIGESMYYPLDAFELIAKEGRKYGLNLCAASQRPRDIPEGVISQMGTLIVHRLINESDRKVVESACSEFDREAAAVLPMLQQGEALVVGTDLPIPLVIQIDEPNNKPRSEGPNYQKYWRKAADQ